MRRSIPRCQSYPAEGNGSREPSGRRSRLGAGALLVAISVGLVLPGAAVAQVEGYGFTIHNACGYPGQPVSVMVEGFHEQSVQGFSLGMRFPADDLQIDRLHFEDTILEAIDTDFFRVFVEPQEGYITIGCLVDSLPPFTGNLIPNIGMPLPFFFIEATISDDAQPDLLLEFEDGLGFPPVRNLFVVDDFPQPPTELVSGSILLPKLPPPAFFRGDATLDAAKDISDVIYVLRYLFQQGRVLWCFDAADTNDDGFVDVSDPIYLLLFLFAGGGAPPDPSATPGLDPTPDDLDCVVSIYERLGPI